MSKQSIYIETTVVSYLVARHNRDLITSARQEQTRLWWEQDLPRYQPFVSPAVEDEIRDGDPEMAAKRLYAISSFGTLAPDARIDAIAAMVAARRILPAKALGDLAHLSYAAFYEVPLMVTWNFRHLANERILWRLQQEFGKLGFQLPDVFTPEQLLIRSGT